MCHASTHRLTTIHHPILIFFTNRELHNAGGSLKQEICSNPVGRPFRKDGATRQVTLAPAFSKALLWQQIYSANPPLTECAKTRMVGGWLLFTNSFDGANGHALGRRLERFNPCIAVRLKEREKMIAAPVKIVNFHADDRRLRSHFQKRRQNFILGSFNIQFQPAAARHCGSTQEIG